MCQPSICRDFPIAIHPCQHSAQRRLMGGGAIRRSRATIRAAAKKRGLHVIARMSPDLNWEDAVQAQLRKSTASPLVLPNMIQRLWWPNPASRRNGPRTMLVAAGPEHLEMPALPRTVRHPLQTRDGPHPHRAIGRFHHRFDAAGAFIPCEIVFLAVGPTDHQDRGPPLRPPPTTGSRTCSRTHGSSGPWTRQPTNCPHGPPESHEQPTWVSFPGRRPGSAGRRPGGTGPSAAASPLQPLKSQNSRKGRARRIIRGAARRRENSPAGGLH
jgi:hypothetical protein